ncbi:Activated RNA polymerase II transcriptional coactivator p15 [Holothuria leucospilota]|nr:Activated RNA polymerase II transcriptional coactivator p15 [Holothuria leucospilota]
MSDNWKQMKDNEGKKMYYNADTREATYDSPSQFKPVQTRVLPPWTAPMRTKGAWSPKRQYPYEQNVRDDEVRVSIGDDRYVTVSIFNGKLYIHIREFFFNQEGRMLPTSKGIALTPQQWFQLGEIQHVIDEAIQEASNGA